MHHRTHKIRAVLFDFDGTLVDSTPLILRCFHATWEQVFGITNEDAEYIRTFGIPLPQAMEQMLQRFGAQGRIPPLERPVEKVEELLRTYRAFNEQWHDQMLRPVAGVDHLLRELKARGFLMGVVTSKRRLGVERGMRLCGLEGWFEVSLCAEDTKRNKPHPEPLQQAMAALNVAPEETIYVGDSVHDIVAGQAAAVLTAAAAWGPLPPTELAALRPDYWLEMPEQLLAIL